MLGQAAVTETIDRRRVMVNGLPTLKELKEQSGRSYRDIAATCDTTESTVFAWVKNNRVTPGNYENFAQAVGADADLVRKISSGSTRSAPAAKGDGDEAEWTKRVLRSGESPELRTVILTFLLLRDPETGQATVTQEDVEKVGTLDKEVVSRVWDRAINSPFVERTSTPAVESRGVWVLKLRIPEG